MRLPLVWTVYLKEVKEALRDRRTLFMMIGLPILLYPLLLIGMSKLQESQEAAQSARTSRVAIWGELPAGLEQKLKGTTRIEVVMWEGAPANVKSGLQAGAFPAPPPAPPALDADDDPPAKKAVSDDAVHRAAREAILSRKVDAVIVLWPGFRQALDQGKVGISSILFDSVRADSRKARDRASDGMRLYRLDLLHEREMQRGLDIGFATGLDIQSQNIATESRKSGQMLGIILPYMLITFSLMSGFYAAIDMTAGEKERGTMQTLLCAPLDSLEIIGGKFLAVWTISLTATVVNLLSLSMTFSRLRFLPGVAMSISPTSLAVAFLMLLPISLMINAVFLAIGAFAKDYKEGQNFLTPVLMGLILPLVATTNPAIELNPYLVFVPIVNIALFIRSVFIGEWQVEYLFLVLLSSFCYASLALVFAARVFERNNVLLGGKDDLGSFLDFTRRRGARPTPALSIFVFAVVLVLTFYASLLLEKRGLVATLAVTEFGFFLAPALAVVALKGFPFQDTLSLRMPRLEGIAAATMIGLSGWAAAGLFLRLLPPPESLVKAMEKLLKLDMNAPLWVSLLLVALTPAICEELLFRGVILSGFRRMGMWAAIGLTALLFGVAHSSIYRLLPTAFLGLLFGYLVWKTGSIIPGMVGHFLNNGFAVTVAQTPDLLDKLGLKGATQLPWSIIAAGWALVALAVLLLQRLPPPESSPAHSPQAGY